VLWGPGSDSMAGIVVRRMIRSPADRLLTPAMPATELVCRGPQPNATRSDSHPGGPAPYNQSGTLISPTQGPGNRLQNPAVLKEIDRSVYL